MCDGIYDRGSIEPYLKVDKKMKIFDEKAKVYIYLYTFAFSLTNFSQLYTIFIEISMNLR